MSNEPTGEFRPATREELTDLALLPRRFDLFVAEVRQSFELLTEKIVIPLTRIEEAIVDLSRRVSDLELVNHRTQDRLAILEAKLEVRGMAPVPAPASVPVIVAVESPSTQPKAKRKLKKAKAIARNPARRR